MDKTVDRSPVRGRSASQILAELREPILIGLSRALRRAFASAVDDLLERLLTEKSWDARQRIDDALDLLRNGREGIEAKFDQACADEWTSRTGVKAGTSPDADADRPKEAARSREPSKLSMLALVDDNAIGDQLTVGRIASRARRRLDEEQVDGLRARFGLLLERDWFADNDFPIAPDVVLECLRKAFAAFGPSQVVAFLLDQFEPKLTADLATLYVELNALMVKRGVMPEIRYQIAKPAGGNDGSSASADCDPTVAAAATAARMGPPGAAQPFGPRFFGGAPQHYPDGFGDGLDPGSGGDVHGGDGGAWHGGAWQGNDGGAHPGTVPVMMPVGAVRALAQQMGQRIPAAQGSAARYLSDATRFGVQHPNLPTVNQDLLTALSTLQVTAPLPGSNVTEQAEKVREHSVEAADAHGTPLERLIIETVSLVFDNVYEDPAIADTIKQQLLRLQVAAFKAALIDPSFFARPEHPMRRLIDRIAGIGSDADFETGYGAPLVTDVAALVTWILASFDRDLDVIEEALQRLEAIVEAETARRADRLAKIATAAARTERLERTREEVRLELMRIVRRDTPEFVGRFVADHWTEVVSRIRNGADYAPFDEARARRTVDTMIWSVGPKSAPDIRRLAAELPQLIADLSRGLSFVATSEAERELFFSELLAWHGAAIAEAKRQHAISQARGEAAIYDGSAAGSDHPAGPTPSADGDDVAVDGEGGDSGDEVDGGDGGYGGEGRDGDGNADEDDDVDTVAALELTNGTEIELHSVNGRIKRFKLGWMSPARTVFIFSRYPKDHWTVRRPMLAQLLEQGRLRVVSRPPKTNQIIESLKAR
ncbi:MAG: DUF1631 family protein [Burkholderiaceae bacterium]